MSNSRKKKNPSLIEAVGVRKPLAPVSDGEIGKKRLAVVAKAAHANVAEADIVASLKEARDDIPQGEALPVFAQAAADSVKTAATAAKAAGAEEAPVFSAPTSEDAPEDARLPFDFEADEHRQRSIASLADEEKELSEAEKKFLSKVTYEKGLVDSNTILSVRHLKKFFTLGTGLNKTKLKAVHDVSFDVKKGEVFGLVGESGCGKTTTGRTIIRLHMPTSGSVYFKGYRVAAGNRWNVKEIQWTKRKGKQRIKEIKANLKEAISDLSNTSDEDKEHIDALKAAAAKKIKAINNHIAETTRIQEAKIRQHNYDNRHIDKNLLTKMQMIFQDPIDSLDPRMTVEDIIEEGLKIQHFDRREAKRITAEWNAAIAQANALYRSQLEAVPDHKEIIRAAKVKKTGESQDEQKERQKLAAQEAAQAQTARNAIEQERKEKLEELAVHYKGAIAKAGDFRELVADALTKVGLLPDYASRYPHEFSGGQRQRIGIARALVMKPELIIADDPISALDVSIRAQIINLLNDIKDEMGLTIIFIAHDLSVVKYFCQRIAVMYYGSLVELATSDELFRHPLHPYTKSLLSAIPKPDPISEKNRKRIRYNPQREHDYSKQGPTLQEIVPGHLVLANDAEIAAYRKEIAADDIVNAANDARDSAIEKQVLADEKAGRFKTK